MALPDQFLDSMQNILTEHNAVLNTGQIYPPTLKPSVPIKVHLGLSAAFTSLYGLLFLLILWQLWLILHYGHRRVSYQSIFLFVCLVWAALRTTLFSFYFRNCSETNRMAPFFSWLFFAFPVFLQFFMLNILVLYFVQVPYSTNLLLFFYFWHQDFVSLLPSLIIFKLSDK